MSAASDRTGMLIVRAWTEAGGALRVRITCVSDLIEGERVTRTANSIEEVHEAAGAWLAALLEITPRRGSGSARA